MEDFHSVSDGVTLFALDEYHAQGFETSKCFLMERELLTIGQ